MIVQRQYDRSSPFNREASRNCSYFLLIPAAAAASEHVLQCPYAIVTVPSAVRYRLSSYGLNASFRTSTVWRTWLTLRIE